jgi:hypothetical protein
MSSLDKLGLSISITVLWLFQYIMNNGMCLKDECFIQVLSKNAGFPVENEDESILQSKMLFAVAYC